MRLFVALDLPEPIHAALRQLISRLQPAGADLRWVRPEGMHLTLKFIGEVPDDKLAPIRAALAGVSSERPAELAFRGLGFFPNPRHPRVFWVGVEASDNLAIMAAQIESVLEPLGIEREKRLFAPHLTLGRFKSEKQLAALQQEIAALPATELGRMQTNEFFLYQSKLARGGAEYTKLEAFPFVRG